MRSLPGVRVLRSLAKANARLTAAIVAVGVVSGLLAPAFAVATGFLVRAIRSHGSVALPLGAIFVVFGIGRLLDPAREQLGDAMWRQLDASVSRRLMGAMSRPPGLAHVERPEVRDAVAKVAGSVTGVFPARRAGGSGPSCCSGCRGSSRSSSWRRTAGGWRSRCARRTCSPTTSPGGTGTSRRWS